MHNTNSIKSLLTHKHQQNSCKPQNWRKRNQTPWKCKPTQSTNDTRNAKRIKIYDRVRKHNSRKHIPNTWPIGMHDKNHLTKNSKSNPHQNKRTHWITKMGSTNKSTHKRCKLVETTQPRIWKSKRKQHTSMIQKLNTTTFPQHKQWKDRNHESRENWHWRHRCAE